MKITFVALVALVLTVVSILVVLDMSTTGSTPMDAIGIHTGTTSADSDDRYVNTAGDTVTGALVSQNTIDFNNGAAGTAQTLMTVDNGSDFNRMRWVREATTGHYALYAWDDVDVAWKPVFSTMNTASSTWSNRTGVPHFWEKLFIQGRTATVTEFMEFRVGNTYPAFEGAGTGRFGLAASTEGGRNRSVWWAENNYGIDFVTSTLGAKDFGTLGTSRIRIPATSTSDNTADGTFRYIRWLFDMATIDSSTEPAIGVASNKTDSYLYMGGGSTYATGGLIGVSGHTATDPGIVQFYTPNAAANAAVERGRFVGKVNAGDGAFVLKERIRLQPQTVTVADNALPATPATSTVTVQSSHIQITCNDADGCNITMSETGAVTGDTTMLVNVSANAVNFADTVGVTEIAGPFAAGQYDSLSLDYVVNTWVERTRSDN